MTATKIRVIHTDLEAAKKACYKAFLNVNTVMCWNDRTTERSVVDGRTVVTVKNRIGTGSCISEYTVEYLE
jgi:hypothetical protein